MDTCLPDTYIFLRSITTAVLLPAAWITPWDWIWVLTHEAVDRFDYSLPLCLDLPCLAWWVRIVPAWALLPHQQPHVYGCPTLRVQRDKTEGLVRVSSVVGKLLPQRRFCFCLQEDRNRGKREHSVLIYSIYYKYLHYIGFAEIWLRSCCDLGKI